MPERPLSERSIVLVGLMGAGKSTIGRRLAQRLSLPFFDADSEIEKAAGMSVTDIFETHGEREFRQGERRVIARLLGGPRHVLATGGGAFMCQATRALARAEAVSVWLKADLDLLVSRVSRRDTRPLLKGQNVREVLSKLMAERDPFYAEADFAIASEDVPHNAIVDKIVSTLKESGHI
ncbi:MAG: shikimate kinase [Pseudomonadota bacterium]